MPPAADPPPGAREIETTQPASRRALPSPWLILLVPPLCWAGNLVIGRAVHADIPPVALTFWRWAVAAIVLLPLAGFDLWEHRRAILRHWRLLSLLGASGVVAFQFFVYQGLQTTTAINGVLIIATIPVAIPMMAFALDGDRVTRPQAIGIALSLLGVAIILLNGDPRRLFGLHLTEGDLWVFAAVPAWALYSVLLRRTTCGPSAAYVAAGHHYPGPVVAGSGLGA